MFSLPKLPYKYSDLEPYIDEQTMIIHHTKHHQAYIDNLNKSLETYPELQNLTVEELLKGVSNVPEEIRQTVINNAGGHANHSFFWKIMRAPKSEGAGSVIPRGKLSEALISTFGDQEKFVEEFTSRSMAVFGSGWCFLVLDKSKKLQLKRHSFQNSPLMQGNTPVLGIDLWEHAYYLKYQNRKLDYIKGWWHVVNWDQANKNFESAMV